METWEIQKLHLVFILEYEIDFDEVVNLIIIFIDLPFKAMINDIELLKNWNPDKKLYE